MAISLGDSGWGEPRRAVATCAGPQPLL